MYTNRWSQRSHIADLLSLERVKYFHARDGVAGSIFFKMFSEPKINLFRPFNLKKKRKSEATEREMPLFSMFLFYKIGLIAMSNKTLLVWTCAWLVLCDLFAGSRSEMVPGAELR